MEGKPRRLRPWLESLINSRMIPGLEWEDEDRTLFRIPWKHRGKHDWSPENSRIFMEWAKQTGRYREGVDPPDYPAWKTRLRCAFNKAPDIEEVKDLSKLDAACPYRVYRLKPVPKTGLARQTMAKPHLSPQTKLTKPYSLATRRRSSHSTQCERHISTVPNIKIENGLRSTEGGSYNDNHHNQTSSYSQPKQEAYGSLSGHSSPTHRSSDGAQGATDCDMVLKVMYCGKNILERTVRSPWGCRVYYGSCPLSPFGQLGPITDFVENIYGPSQAESVSLPSCSGLMKNEKQEKLGMELLERGVRRGVVLKCKDNSIHAYRLCQSAVFYSSHLRTGGKPLKLRRADVSGNEATLLFDYHDQYIPALKDYLDGLGDKPDPYCYLVFGQEVSMFNLDSNVLVVIAVACQSALHDLEKAEAQMSVRTPKVEVSNSNELDTLAQTLMNLYQSPDFTRPNLAIKYSPSESVPSSSSSHDPWYQSPCSTLNSTEPHKVEDNVPTPMEEDTV